MDDDFDPISGDMIDSSRRTRRGGGGGRSKKAPQTVDQLARSQQFAEIMQQNELLAKENRLFDSFLQRNASLVAEQPEKQAKSSSRRQHARPAHEPTISDVSNRHSNTRERESS